MAGSVQEGDPVARGKGDWEGGREEGREGRGEREGREGGRGGRGRREGGMEVGREGGRGRREGGREGGRGREGIYKHTVRVHACA